MKGQAREPVAVVGRMNHIDKLVPVPESMPIIEEMPETIEEVVPKPVYINHRYRSRSFEVGENGEEYIENNATFVPTSANALRSINLPEHEHGNKKIEDLIHDESKTPLVVNRNLYRAHRQMRLSVLEACKRFDDMQLFRVQKEHQQKQNDATKQMVGGAGLVMRHGHAEKLSTEAIREILLKRQQEQQLLLEKANKLSGRGGSTRRRDKRKKTVSDMSAMLASNNNQATSESDQESKPQTPSPTDKNLLVHQSLNNFKLSVDSRSCPPSPAIDQAAFVPNPGRNLPFLPSMSLEDSDSPMNSNINDGGIITVGNVVMNENLIFCKNDSSQSATNSNQGLTSSLKDHLENLPLREEEESPSVNNDDTDIYSEQPKGTNIMSDNDLVFRNNHHNQQEKLANALKLSLKDHLENLPHSENNIEN